MRFEQQRIRYHRTTLTSMPFLSTLSPLISSIQLVFIAPVATFFPLGLVFFVEE